MAARTRDRVKEDVASTGIPDVEEIKSEIPLPGEKEWADEFEDIGVDTTESPGLEDIFSDQPPRREMLTLRQSVRALHKISATWTEEVLTLQDKVGDLETKFEEQALKKEDAEGLLAEKLDKDEFHSFSGELKSVVWGVGARSLSMLLLALMAGAVLALLAGQDILGLVFGTLAVAVVIFLLSLGWIRWRGN